jgi:nucleotide-binding universal stress UspA family protein
MPIVIGTDFSPNASQAADAAAAIAAALPAPLELLHVVDGFWRELPERAQAPLLEEVRGRLGAEADRVGQRGITVQEQILFGIADEALVSHAEASAARLLVVSSVGRRAPARWLLGSVAERTAQTSPVPVLVVRDASPFLAWTEGKRRLRVMVAADFSSSADAAIRWVAELRAIGPCDVVVAYSSWPPAERRRLGTGVRRTVFENDPEIDVLLRQDLERKIGRLPGEGEVRVRVESSLGHVSGHLVEMSGEEGVDLLVVGAHQRRGAGHLWQRSVSRGLLRAAAMSVACVPAARRTGHEAAPIPDIRTVLAATDFSDLGDRAVPFAYGMLPQGGTVHLVHVVEVASVQDLCYRHYETGFPPTPEQRAAQEPELAVQLQALIPAGAAMRGVETLVHVIEARTAGAAVAMAAERLGADVICVGSHGRSGLTATFAGSVAQDIIARSGRPVVVVGPARD